MNKILVGLIVGAVLGLIDGATAWFTPAVRDQMLSIIIGSTGKGIIAGIAAGWFARRVQSVPKGIAFGFAVGLLLAFAVAAMPSATGEHYWWQIMVPGSILGGVIGWATQRYGRESNSRGRSVAAAISLVVLLTATSVSGGEGHQHGRAPAKNAAFERLKALAGSHEANLMTVEGQPTRVAYAVEAGGTVVQERIFAGEPHEMITMCTADGEGILATHYCSGGNQPTMRLNSKTSNENQLVFDFEKITGHVARGHISGVAFLFAGNDAVEQVWSNDKGPYVRLFFNTGR